MHESLPNAWGLFRDGRLVGDMRTVTSLGKSSAAVRPVGRCPLASGSMFPGSGLMSFHPDILACIICTDTSWVYIAFCLRWPTSDLWVWDPVASLAFSWRCPLSALRPLPRRGLSSSVCALLSACPCHFTQLLAWGLREESVAQGPPPCRFFLHVFSAYFSDARHGPFVIARMPKISTSFCRGLREESVAQGPPPTGPFSVLRCQQPRLRGSLLSQPVPCTPPPHRCSVCLGPWGLVLFLACMLRICHAFGCESLPPEVLYCCSQAYHACFFGCHRPVFSPSFNGAFGGACVCLACMCWQHHNNACLTQQLLMTWTAHQAFAVLCITAGTLLAGLWSMLGQQVRARFPSTRWIGFLSLFRGFERCVLGLGMLASPCCSPLDWRRCPDARLLSRRRHKGSRRFCAPTQDSERHWGLLPGLRVWAWLFGFLTLPTPVDACHSALLRPCFFVALSSFVPGSYAMQHPGLAAAHVLPHDVPVEELAHYVGPRLEDRDVTESGTSATNDSEVWLSEDFGCMPIGRGRDVWRWLGVVILTPHYRPVRAAVRCLHHHGLQHVLDVIHEDAPGGGIRNGQLCIPVRPQPFPGFGTFLRFPSIVHRHPKGRFAATVVDLRRLGGHIFACLLPQRMPAEELLDFVTHMVAYSEEALVLVIGSQDRPHDFHLPVHLQDGDLLVFDRPQRPPRNAFFIHHLFEPDANWGDPACTPLPESNVGVLVQHQNERIFLPKQHHAGQTLKDALLGMWDYARGGMTMGVFPTPNLEYRGNPCSHVACVLALPEVLQETPPNVRRRDIFALCDFRALGFSPRIVHTSVPTLHMPSVAATFDICVPTGMRLRTWEGTNTGDEVTFEGHSILTFFAEEEASPTQAQHLYIDLSDMEDEAFDWSLRSHPAVVRANQRSPSGHNQRQQGRNRSRSRHRDTYHSAAPFPLRDLCGPLRFRLDKWPLGFKHAACLPGPCEVTSVFPCLEPSVSPWLPGPLSLLGPQPLVSKLLREPTSHSSVERENLDNIRDFMEDDGRPWPYLPADDPFALQGVLDRNAEENQGLEVGVGATFVMCLLTPEYRAEQVSLNLVAPVSIEDAFLAVQESRDPIRARLFPWLVLIDPQPAQGFGILLALPGWAVHDTVVCFDTSDIDGRLFVAGAPIVATRNTLLDIACLSPHELFDVYVGASPVPMHADDETDLHRGLCVFFTHRHDLPGPFFQLHESLLTSEVWDVDPVIPEGPDDEHLCVIWEMGHRRVRVAENHFHANRALAAQLVEVTDPATSICLATPAVADASIAGFLCWNACAVAQPTGDDIVHPQPPVAALLDCRAMLQGWSLLTSSQGQVRKVELEEELSTFAPAGWEVHVEGLQLQDGFYVFESGRISFASFVPMRDNDDVSLDGDAAELGSFTPATDASDSSEDDDSDSPQSPAARPRSRSPYRSPNEVGSGDTTWSAPFVILSQEYAPEVVCVPLHAGTSAADALNQVQARRDSDAVRRFSALIPVDPQPFGEFALVVARPVWSSDVFVVFDLSKLSGAVFCWLSSPHLTRASILAITGVPDSPGLEVYVPEHDLPLGPTEVCRLSSGACISLVPPSCQFFAVSALDDMLQSTEGWNAEATLPCMPGEFLHVLTDGGPCSMALPSQRTNDLRVDVSLALGVPGSTVTLQLAEPPIDDFSDSGMLGWNVLIATQDHAQDIQLGRGCAYFLDLRPILCGVAWAFAEAGRVSVALIRRQCARPEVGRTEVRVEGGRQAAPGNEDFVLVHPGDVLIVSFADVADVHMPPADEADGLADPGRMSPAATDDADGNGSTPHGPPSGSVGSASSVAPPAHNQDSSMCDIRPIDQPGTASVDVPPATQRLWPAALASGVICMLVALLQACPEAWLVLPLAFGRHRTVPFLCLLYLHALMPLEAVQIDLPGAALASASVPLATRPAACMPPLRVLPTPCRAPVGAHIPAFDADILCDLNTLLEESVRERGDETFLDSSTLLDVLRDHFAKRTETCPEAVPKLTRDDGHTVLTICLSDLMRLPDTVASQDRRVDVFDLDGRQCLLPGCSDRVDSLLSRADIARLRPPPMRLEKPDRFNAWLRTGCIGRKPAPGETLVLTSDGSFTPHVARNGWGITCSLVDQTLLLPGQFIGCMYGDISALLGPTIAPEVSVDAYSAEVAGLALCAVAVLQFAVSCPVLIRADNLSALEGVRGQLQMRDDPLCRMARSLHASAHTLSGHSLSYQHVHGHDGDCANELADALARVGAAGGTALHPLCFAPVTTSEELSLYQWMPHICLSRSRPREVPLLRDQVMTWSRGAGLCEHPPDFAMQPFLRAFPSVDTPAPDVPRAGTVLWTLASFNVLSLQDSDARNEGAYGLHGVTGRPTLLSQSLEQMGVLVAGIQEARTPTGTMRCGNFHRYASGADAKTCFGVELWIHDHSPCPPSSIVVLHASPTVLIASGSSCGQTLRLLVAHGPHRAHPPDVKASWWKQLVHLYAMHMDMALYG